MLGSDSPLPACVYARHIMKGCVRRMIKSGDYTINPNSDVSILVLEYMLLTT